jgi:membrane-bound serine protease (ClpP class)
MRRLLGALALGLGLASLAGRTSAEPLGADPAIVAVQLGSLPTALITLAMLVAGIALVAMELHLPTHGILGIGGVLVTLLGVFLLLAPPDLAAPVLATIMANGWLVALASAGLGACGLLAMWAALRVRRLPVHDSLGRLAGARGVALSSLAPGGTVLVQHERWSAVADGATVAPGERVEVVEREGLTLRVRRIRPVEILSHEPLPSQGLVRPGIRVERTR